MRRLALGVLIAVSIVGCSQDAAPESRSFRTTLPQVVDPQLPVVLKDATGLVTEIGAAADPQANDGRPVLRADPSDPRALIVSWLGSPCEVGVALAVEAIEGGYLLNIDVSRDGSCPLVGLARGVRIVTTSPIPPSSIQLNGRT